jgi:hypothetical protein
VGAYVRGAGDQELADFIAAGMGKSYFQEYGTRADGLDVSLLDIDYFMAQFD